ncbi:MAG: Ku protein [Thermodesulfovibrionales bacterium]
MLVSFALVNIPVKLYTAVHKKDLDFHLLHKSCSSPLQYERFCPVCKWYFEKIPKTLSEIFYSFSSSNLNL